MCSMAVLSTWKTTWSGYQMAASIVTNSENFQRDTSRFSVPRFDSLFIVYNQSVSQSIQYLACYQKTDKELV